jgi:hypothetical protein
VKEIKTGAFGTVHAGQFIHVESTAEGTGGEFYDLVQEADALKRKDTRYHRSISGCISFHGTVTTATGCRPTQVCPAS